METLVKNKKECTYDDYVKTPEGSMIQLIEGQLVQEPSAPYISHQRISRKLLYKIENYVRENDCGEVFNAPTDVNLDKYNCLQPDLLFVAKERLDIIGEKCIKGAPDLVIEILSTWTTKRDLVQKKKLYEKFGVKEYWIVHLNDQLLEMFVLEDTQYILYNVYTKGDKLESNALNNFWLELKEIF